MITARCVFHRAMLGKCWRVYGFARSTGGADELHPCGIPPPLAGNAATATPLRLQLDPNRPAEPYLDGAWWPRSTELPAELPTLLEELSAHLGSIALVGYHRDAWNAAPGHLDLAGHPVHLQGFVSPNPPTLVVIGDTDCY